MKGKQLFSNPAITAFLMSGFSISVFLSCLGCAAKIQTQNPAELSNEKNLAVKAQSDAHDTTARISIKAGDKIIYANLFDNNTAKSFIKLLPITLNAFDRIGLVKSTVLPQRISDEGKRTRDYVKGAIFYWPEGPEVAFCYSDHLPKTVVDIIHIGLIESGVEVFEKYSGEIYIALAENK